jgi:hypothetical protein
MSRFSRSSDPARRAGAVLLTLATVTALAGGVPARAAETTFELTTSPTRVAHTPYLLDLDVSLAGDLAIVSIGLRRGPLHLTFARGAGVPRTGQRHTYEFLMPKSAFSCQDDLGVCTLDTGDAMGKYGRVELAFGAEGEASVSTVRCRHGATASQTTTRPGSTSGGITLHTFNSFFGGTEGTVTNVGDGNLPDHLQARASQTVFFKACGPHRNPCIDVISLTVAVFGADDSSLIFSIVRKIPDGNATLSLTTQEPTAATDPAVIHHTAGAVLGPSSFTMTGTASRATVDATDAGPLVTGGMTFTKSGPPSTSGTSCLLRVAQGTMEGDLNAHFDGVGDVPLGTQNAQAVRQVVA